MRRTALVVMLMATVASGAGEAQTRIELGDLHAVPSSDPPFRFRLSIFRQSDALPGAPTVVVRRPTHALFFVTHDALELRLVELADVELEISHAGHTVNRLLLKAELEAARARMRAGMRWDRYQAAKTRGRKGARLAPLLEEAYQAHAAWAHVDPDGARGQLDRIVRERTRLLAERFGRQEVSGEGMAQRKATGESAALENRLAALEREMREIREEMQRLVGQMTTWKEGSLRPRTAGQGEQRAVGPAPTVSPLMATLGGLFVAGLASLLTGYGMQRRAAQRNRHRRRLLAAAMHAARDALPVGQWGQPEARAYGVERQPLTSVVRRVHLPPTSGQRVHLSGPPSQGMSAYGQRLEQAPLVAPDSHPGMSEPLDLRTTFANLRQELIHIRESSRSRPIQMTQIHALLAQLAEMAKRM